MLIRYLGYEAKRMARILNMPWSDFRDFQRELKLGPCSPTPASQPPPVPMPAPPPLTEEQKAMLIEESEEGERDAFAEIG